MRKRDQSSANKRPTQHKEESLITCGGKKNITKKKQKQAQRGDSSNAKRKSGKRRKWAPHELEPHFILDLGFSFFFV